MTTYIIGHKNPDTDSICAAISYADLKNTADKTKEFVPARSGNINDETRFILDRFNAEDPALLDDATDKKVILVDHSEPKQRPKNMDKGKIIEVLDHHNINFQQAEPIQFYTEPAGSTCTIIAKKYFDKNIPIPKTIAGLLLGSIISDTVIFKSPITTEDDRQIAKKLKTIADVDDLDKFGIDMFNAKSGWSKKTAEEIITTDYKEYELGGKKIGIAQIETVDASELEPRKSEFLKTMKQIKEKTDLDTIIVLLTDIIKEGCITYILSDSADMIEKTFDKKIKDNEMYLPGVLSRKKQIVPPLEKALS